ncbi:PadR family transcriptional regulator [Amycolatopsis sp. GM8]|uniref:PadR family transcriptional regulator n=1 Tax=Amycolatopsis sp. GM8 TaxID=2896530 RepID=UPI001F20E81E|nr:PadR family transcriptional regulator [Amycolatopsis sp. GM8]
MEWGLAEWTVLALLREEPRHGFAIAALTGPDGELGRVWHIPRPMIYRALGRLESEALIAPASVKAASGPQRTVFALTKTGRREVDAWLRRPVEHVRDFRSVLLMKLALLDRLGLDPRAMLRSQHDILLPIVAALAAERRHGEGFATVLTAWRHSSAQAALGFVAELLSSARSGRASR